MQGYQCPICFEHAVDEPMSCGMMTIPQTKWSDIAYLYGVLSTPRSQSPISVRRGVWASPEIGLRVLMRESAWNFFKACTHGCQVSFQNPKESADKLRHTLIITYSREYSELQKLVPGLEVLSEKIIEGIRNARIDGGLLRVEYLINEDFENPSWKQLAIEIYSSEGLDYEQAIILWKRLEDEIRPRIKEVIRKNATEFQTSPIEISNENISIGFNW